ncbi:beta-CASP ribonuclease aCPSF1 [Candidatus Woesearchaeota archaeon]|nr:beta-CASP ribonuclease aCPSF1 [Candidatus Woesearchaeota archaeon]
MPDILEEVLRLLPDPDKISDKVFEGANIVLYTKDKEFFLNNEGAIIKVVDALKKRVELRPDPSVTMNVEKAEEVIKSIIPAESGISSLIFDQQRSMVIIEVEKPGLAIGKQGELLKEIKIKTFWVPLIRRTPALRSKLIENIRYVLYENNDFRRKFLNKIGKRVYGGWTKEKRNEWIRISFLGGAREVGRSCLLLQTPESRILLDCGINVAAATDERAYPMFDIPEFVLKDIDAIILSHAHLDHCGLIPALYKMGYDGPMYCTAPTRDVASLLALDYISIAQKEAIKLLYSSTDIKNMVKHTICLDYEEVTDITPDIRLTLYNAGHTLGSSMAHMHIGNGLHNFLYTGDMNYETSNLLAAAVTKFPRLETVLLESTYGGKNDIVPTRKESERYLLDVISKTIKQGGRVLMPVLGVGRSQEVMLILERCIREGLIDKIPIYVQGMVWDVTAIHTTYPDFFNNKVKRNIFHKDHNPFLSEVFKQVAGYNEMQEVIEEKGPCVIMATSGMMVGGPSVEYFKALADNPKNALVLTCYQGEGSLGRRLQQGDKVLNFPKGEKMEELQVKMEIHTISGFSGHSSRKQLMQFVYNLDPKPKRIIVDHGESSKCLDLASSLHKLHMIETNAPKNLEAVRIR